MSFSHFMISSGCSNILNDRRNCFLGLTNGFDIFRKCAPSGDAFLVRPKLGGCLIRLAGRSGFGTGETTRSATGEDASNISDSASVEDGSDCRRPVPNLNEGNRDSGFGRLGIQLVL